MKVTRVFETAGKLAKQHSSILVLRGTTGGGTGGAAATGSRVQMA